MVQTLEEIVDRLFPRQGKWTEKDYFSLPETNRIVELSNGRLIITPSPTDQHQRIVGEIYFLIRSYLLNNNIGEIRCSPLDVWLYEGTIRQPDIVFMIKEHIGRIHEKYWGVPDLVVEILSEGTEKQDRVDKFSEYAHAGILEYWIVDPLNQTIEIFALEKGAYVIVGQWSTGETAYSKVLAGFVMKVGEIFQ